MDDLRSDEIVRQVAERNVSVLVLSAYDGEHVVQSMLEVDISGYLTKRSSGEQIIEAVLAIARGEDSQFSSGIVKVIRTLQKREKVLAAHRISQREQEVLRLVVRGMQNSDIAEVLAISVGTVRNHVASLYEKIGVHSRSSIIAWAHGQHFLITHA